jgi:uncharacterized protein YndB with AHSA1/START domain
MANDIAQADALDLSRIIDAPRALVFEVWTQTEHFAQWFGPNDVTVPFCRIEPRVGGLLHFCHRLGDMEVWLKGTYREFVAPERLVFDLTFVDTQGRPAAHPMIPDWPVGTIIRTTVTFADIGGRTEFKGRQVLLPAEAAATDAGKRHGDMARAGWTQTMERLARYVATLAK